VWRKSWRSIEIVRSDQAKLVSAASVGASRSNHAVLDLPDVVEHVPGHAPDEVARRPDRAAARPALWQLAARGGRQRVDGDWVEPIFETAVREVEEELGGQVSYQAGDFQIEQLASFQGETRLSPSFGALTAYQFTFFRAFHLKPIRLNPGDCWLRRADFVAETTPDGQPVRGDHLPYLEEALGYSIEQLPSSFVGY